MEVEGLGGVSVVYLRARDGERRRGCSSESTMTVSNFITLDLSSFWAGSKVKYAFKITAM